MPRYTKIIEAAKGRTALLELLTRPEYVAAMMVRTLLGGKPYHIDFEDPEAV